MKIQSFEVTPFFVNCYILSDGGEAILIDPGEYTPQVQEALAGLTVKIIVNTHGHCDHCGGNAAAVQDTNAPLAIHADDRPMLQAIVAQGQMFGLRITASPGPDRLLAEGDVIEVGAVRLKVLHAPGHSLGHILLAGDGFVFAGDVLFSGSIGRTDLPGGDYSQLINSIRTKLLTLPDETVVYSGHGPDTTIGAERRTNPFLAGA